MMRISGLIASMIWPSMAYAERLVSRMGDLEDNSALMLAKAYAFIEDNGSGFADLLVQPESSGRNETSLSAKKVGAISSGNSFLALEPMERISDFFAPAEKDLETKDNCYLIKVNKKTEPGAFGKLEALLRGIECDVQRTFSIGKDTKGYKVCFPTGQLPLGFLAQLKFVDHVERDQRIKASQLQKKAPWSLSALTHGVSHDIYAFDRTGKGVTVYVIDSGIDMIHREFGDRASVGFSTLSTDWLTSDCSGHGTEVASVLAGQFVGVAKESHIVVCSVLDCAGEGSNSELVAALDWIAKNFKAPGVVNMSIGGPKSRLVDSALASTVAMGIPVVVAAGNSSIDACLESPSGVESAIVVGAINQDSHLASFSNYGPCVDLYAPGSMVLAAAARGGPKAYEFSSGTSLASPLVAGIVALLLEAEPGLSPRQIKDKLATLARHGVIKGNLRGSPNLLAQAPMPTALPGKQILVMEEPHLPKTPNMESLGLILSLAGAALLAILGICIAVFLWRRRRRNRQAAPSEYPGHINK